MKKLVLLIVALLLVSIMAVRAEEIDLSGMTTKELIELDLQISEELHSRDEYDSKYLYQGAYTVGEDLEEGRYVFKCEKVIENKRGYGEIYLQQTHERPQGARMLSGDEWSARLTAGSTLWLTYLECTFVKVD